MRRNVDRSRRLRVLGWPAFRNRVHNPYNALLYTAMQAAGAQVDEFTVSRALWRPYDVLHVHWPEEIGRRDIWRATLKSAGLLLCIASARLRGARIVWTAHNAQSHNQHHPRLEGLFWSLFVRLLHGYISLSEAAREVLLQRLPALERLPSFIIPHGHYRDAYDNDVDRHSARAALHQPSSSRVLLFAGQVRKYKGVPELIHAFRELRDPEAVLIVAGEPESAELARELRCRAEGDPRILLHLAFVPEAKLQAYFRAADLAILPYRNILNSGSAMLALSFDCPVLVPAFASMLELRERVGSEWVRVYESSLSGVVLGDALKWARRPAADRPPLESFGWSSIAERTVTAYQHLIPD